MGDEAGGQNPSPSHVHHVEASHARRLGKVGQAHNVAAGDARGVPIESGHRAGQQGGPVIGSRRGESARRQKSVKACGNSADKMAPAEIHLVRIPKCFLHTIAVSQLVSKGLRPARRLVAAVLLATGGLLLSAAAPEEAPVPGWTARQLESLDRWRGRAAEDALPVLDGGPLERARRSGNSAAIDGAATELALRLARLHLLGAAPAGQRAGWHIVDTDSAVDLRQQLARAVLLDRLDSFFAGLRPLHPDYAALRAAYATEPDAEARQVLARNMERWRWMPQTLGRDFVLVNVPAFEARLWRNGSLAGTWRVIVGKPATPTPVFAATITGVTLNPWWMVPASIMREKRGNFPARQGYVWSGGRVSQKPGPGNSLGQMKLDMANPFTVYLHDTPSKQLFAQDRRAFSHGCVRVGEALDFAARLLEGVSSREGIDAIVLSRDTTTIALAASLPVYVAYFTAGTDRTGAVVRYADIYGRDRGLETPLAPPQGCGG